jgi:two-component system chemotaxis response regulator CheY
VAPAQKAHYGFGIMKTCLVVDDSRVIRQVTRRLLETLQFETGEAEDAASALDAVRAHMPDVILLDASLPGMTGTEFLRALRRDHDGKGAAVILCTAENDIPTINEALAAGANEVLIKPFDKDNLRAKFAEMGLV